MRRHSTEPSKTDPIRDDLDRAEPASLEQSIENLLGSDQLLVRDAFVLGRVLVFM